MHHFDTIIIGAGISGLTYARLLQQHTNKTFLVLEKEATPGGLCRTINVDGNAFDIGGGHFLYTKHQHVYDFVFSHIPQTEFNRFDRVTKIHIHDTYIDYPIEQNLWQLPKQQQYEYLCSLIDAYHQPQNNESFEAWLIKTLGAAIYENYLKPYNEKIWGVPVSELATDWLYKIPMVDIKQTIHAFVFGQHDENTFPSHHYFYYPKQGGFQRIIDAIYEPIKDHVYLCNPVTSIVFPTSQHDKSHNKFIINNAFSTYCVINTIAWEALPLRGWQKHRDIDKLKHNSITVSLEKAEYSNNWHWCYIPDKNIAHHREFYVNNYVKNNANQCKAFETNINRFTVNQQTNALAHHVNQYAYPVPVHNTQQSIQNILTHYQKLGMYGLGRWGQWQYHNSDVCIHEAFNLFGRLEKTLI